MSRLHRISMSILACTALSLAACGGMETDQQQTQASIVDGKNDSFGPPCGGIAGLTCPEGMRCEYVEYNPDALGTCVDDVGMPCGPWPGGECGEGETCDSQGCGIGAGGVCVAQGDACFYLYQPVCGCDGETYSNDCFRVLAGAALDHDGECEMAPPPVCGGIANLPCPEGMRCEYVEYNPDATGTCVEDVAQACGPWPGGECGAGETCDTLGCGIGAGGVCVTKGDACFYLYQPVCGCDGKTYSNDCFRVLAGAALNYDGECEMAPPPVCGGIANLPCPEDMRCEYDEYNPDATGTCVDIY